MQYSFKKIFAYYKVSAGLNAGSKRHRRRERKHEHVILEMSDVQITLTPR